MKIILKKIKGLPIAGYDDEKKKADSDAKKKAEEFAKIVNYML